MKKPRRPHQTETPSPAPELPSKRISAQTIFLIGAVAASVLVLAAIAAFMYGGRLWAADSHLRLKDIPFDGTGAYDYLKQICDLGPRPSGSAAIVEEQKLLQKHFEKLGAKVEYQLFQADYPIDGPDLKMLGQKVPMANMIVRWNPEAKERVMICGHYDTLPFPLQDRVDTHGRFIGANDNGSGVALLMELGNELAKQPPKIGVDFVFFDGEEFIFNRDGKYFCGSEHFAQDYVDHPPAFRYRGAVLLDMVGGAELRLTQDLLSVSWPDSRPLVNDLWATAARLGVREFEPQLSINKVTDDHLALHEIGKIPSCDLIDVSYMDKQWHTRDDTLEHCSALSLAKVGWVLREWVKGL